ncbi:MAG: hypothetical protein ABIG44_01915 [Planctomycetota bacterium]
MKHRVGLNMLTFLVVYYALMAGAYKKQKSCQEMNTKNQPDNEKDD